MGSSIKLLVLVCVTVVAMAGFASRVQADYHVSKVSIGLPDIGELFAACPSNYYDCACYRYGDRRGEISQGPPSLTAFFTVTNLCGYQQLNHYLNSDGTYSVYVSKGDGTLVATCYGADQDRVTLTCRVQHAVDDLVYDHLLCYGGPCQTNTIDPISMGLNNNNSAAN